jgi:hypothetical protein
LIDALCNLNYTQDVWVILSVIYQEWLCYLRLSLIRQLCESVPGFLLIKQLCEFVPGLWELLKICSCDGVQLYVTCVLWWTWELLKICSCDGVQHYVICVPWWTWECAPVLNVLNFVITMMDLMILNYDGPENFELWWTHCACKVPENGPENFSIIEPFKIRDLRTMTTFLYLLPNVGFDTDFVFYCIILDTDFPGFLWWTWELWQHQTTSRFYYIILLNNQGILQ